MSWNQQKVDDLKKLWSEGVATSRIGEQLGFTWTRTRRQDLDQQNRKGKIVFWLS